MTDSQMKQTVKEQFPFLSDKQYDEILELIMEIEANVAIDTFIALIDVIFFSETFKLIPTG